MPLAYFIAGVLFLLGVMFFWSQERNQGEAMPIGGIIGLLFWFLAICVLIVHWVWEYI